MACGLQNPSPASGLANEFSQHYIPRNKRRNFLKRNMPGYHAYPHYITNHEHKIFTGIKRGFPGAPVCPGKAEPGALYICLIDGSSNQYLSYRPLNREWQPPKQAANPFLPPRLIYPTPHLVIHAVDNIYPLRVSLRLASNVVKV